MSGDEGSLKIKERMPEGVLAGVAGLEPRTHTVHPAGPRGRGFQARSRDAGRGSSAPAPSPLLLLPAARAALIATQCDIVMNACPRALHSLLRVMLNALYPC